MRRHVSQEADKSLRVAHPSAIDHFLTNQSERVRQLEVHRPKQELGGRLQTLVSLAEQKRIPVILGPANRVDHSPISLVLKDFPYADFGEQLEHWKSRKRVGLVALDHIQDPQNFGAIVRSAEGFGAHAIVFPKDRSVAVTSAVVQASAGAVATVPMCRVTNLGETLRKLKEAGFWIVGSDMGTDAVPAWKLPDLEKWVLVVGSEGDGMGQLIRGLCDWIVQIPLKGKIESLNANAAASALLYELSRPK